MSQREVSREEDKRDAREATVGDLEVLDGEDVRGGDNEVRESIAFYYVAIKTG